MTVSRRYALKVSASLIRVCGYLEHLLPVKLVACRRHLVVLVAGVGDSLRDVCGVGCYLAGDYALLNVVEVGQAEMLRRSYIAQKIRAACRCNRAADSGGS